MTRPTKATIDLSALQQNAQRLRDRAPNSRCLFVVKADAYGHGIELVAPALQNLGDGFAVAHCDEGIALRHLGSNLRLTAGQARVEPKHTKGTICPK